MVRDHWGFGTLVVSIFFFLLIFKNVYVFLKERVQVEKGHREKEREREREDLKQALP